MIFLKNIIIINKERKALLDACKIAEISVTRLFNESSAVALSYGIFRKQDLTASPKVVIFVDLGHSKMSAYCAQFTNEKCQILAEKHAKNVGCRNMVMIIYFRTGNLLNILVKNSMLNTELTH